MKRGAFALGATLILLGPFFTYLLTNDVAVAWLALIAASAFTIVTRIDDITEFQFGPLRAKMRETLAAATATLEQLRRVAIAMARVLLTDLMAGHFMSGMSLAKQLDLHDEIMNLLDGIGASEHQKADAESDWKKGIGLIYHRAIRKAIADDDSLATADKDKLTTEFQGLLDMKEWKVPSPRQMEQFFSERGYLAEKAKQWIDDYKYYRDTGKLRNRDAFAKQ